MEIRSELTLEAAEAAEAAAEAAETAETAEATLNVDLFQVLVGQINKLNKLLRKFVLPGLTVSVDRFHGLFSFLGKTCTVCSLKISLSHFQRLSIHESPTKEV